jgi:DHA2 family multidrug resistance protein-like MFS transporter
VAIVGSLAAASYRSQLHSTLTAAHAPDGVIHQATSSVAAADAIGAHVGGQAGGQLVSAAHDAFVSSMALGIRVAALAALAAAIAAVFALPRRVGPEPAPAIAAPAPATPRTARRPELAAAH